MRAGVVVGVVGFGVVVAGMVSVVRVVAGGVTGAAGSEAAREAMVTIRVILARQIGRVAPRIRIGRVVVGAGVWNTYVKLLPHSVTEPFSFPFSVSAPNTASHPSFHSSPASLCQSV